MRAPALPIEVFRSLSDWQAPEPPSPAGDPLDRLLGDPYVALALAAASPAFVEALRSDRSRRLVRPLLSYLTRMSTRATPFGLFAGVARGSWGPSADVDLGGRPSFKRARPDMDWLYALVRRLERDPAVRAGLVVRTHPTARIRGGRAVVVGLDVEGQATSAAATSVRATPVVCEALDLCAEGALAADVARELCNGNGRNPVKTRRLLDSLCDHGFLTTGLRPALTAAPAREVARALGAAGGAPDATKALDDLLEQLAAWEALPAGDALRTWGSLTSAAAALETRTPAIQVDARFERDVRLPRAVAREASRAAELLFRLSAWPAGPPLLDRWRAQFAARYGHGRPVPVLELVDRGLPAADVGGAAARARDRVLLAVAGEALRRGETVVELDDARIAELESADARPKCPPPSVDVFCALAAASPGNLDDGRFQLVVNGASAPAGRSHGRFGHLFADDAAGWAPAADTVVAELHFEPLMARSGNVMIRMPRASHAIHLGGGRPDDGIPVIPVDELAVTFDGSRLRLLWTREGIHVTATYCHLLNQRLAPALARFLYEVSRDGETVVDRFSWGAAQHLPALPRLQVGRVVLRRAEWTVDRAFLRAYAGDRIAAVRQSGLPRHVLLGGMAELLLVDLHSDSGALLLSAAARAVDGERGLRVTEALPAPEHAFAPAHDGHRPLELVVPVVPAKPDRDATRPRRVAADRMSRLPGGEWLYAKLYTTPDLADDLIGGPLRGLAGVLTHDGCIASWFFLRFADPDFHVRLRLRGDPATLVAACLPRLCDWAGQLVGDGRLERFAIDTYEPEIERYGGPGGMLLAERAFAADSVAAAELVARREAILREIDWTHLGVWSVDDLLDALGIPREERARWYRERYAIYEHAAAFRGARDVLRTLLDPDTSLGPACQAAASILRERRAALRDVARGLGDLSRRDALWLPLGDVAESLVHMHCNRLCVDAADVEPAIVGLAGLTAASLAAWPSRSGGWANSTC